MRSMTGYGASSAKTLDVELEVQIRSVNARFLDLRFHIPKEYFGFEAELKKRAGSLINRGCVDIFVHRRPVTASRVVPITINKEQAKAWLEAIQTLKKTLKIKEPIGLQDVMDLSHIFDVTERNDLGKTEEPTLRKAFDSALKACQKAREQEGAELQREILRLLEELASIVKELSPWREKAQERIEKRLQERLKDVLTENSDPERMAVETALQLDKMDIREEIVRLSEHVKACQNWAKENDLTGKKLDFYAQELLRETNTIGSKTQLPEMTELVVKAKTVIENFREQVQNVE
jgi:uncharacterized protein (TIGR00255 family)